MMANGAVVKYRSKTQASRALRMAEAEDHAVVTGTAEDLGMQSMMTDLGLSARVRVWTDSNAAEAIVSRRGRGKSRLTEMNCLWLHEVTKSGRVKMKRVTGEQHLADHLTKGKSWCEIDDHDSEYQQHRERTQMEEVAGKVPRTRRDV